MADKHPYTASQGGLATAIAQLRSSFPSQFTGETLKKLGIAPNNESAVINILRFVGVVDQDGNKNPKAGTIFNLHTDDDFQKGFRELVKPAYNGLFELHADHAWTLPADKLISFFRSTDGSSALVGQRQAATFQTLAALCGFGDAVAAKTTKTRSSNSVKATKSSKSAGTAKPTPHVSPSSGPGTQPDARAVGLTVRVEVNLPAAADQETYDKIFKSIRENLLNG